MKLNVRQLDGTGARLGIASAFPSEALLITNPSVMRKEAVYTLLLNITLFHGMSCALSPQDPRYLRFSAIENGIATHYNLRVSYNHHSMGP
jgi:Ran-binding protein 3